MDQNPKQQVAEKLRNSTNVLVTVSKNPSVDQLAAALGLSLMLDALGKHTATVFSGQIPDILKFLEPEKTFDSNVDGLRDFIISLDKEKADKLRYKVEDDVVKVYITPYRSKITEQDLTFEQGDFNVDAVIALGVKKKADLDEAITAHGRILHDATVIAVNAGEVGGDVGSIDWTDSNANSLCEMLVSISEALEGGVLDGPMSTAFLTGIVSVTDRFSNDRTTPKLMTMAAQLMAAGANQQLISQELQLDDSGSPKVSQKKDETTIDLHESKKDKPKTNEDTAEKYEQKQKKSPIDKIDKDLKLDELEKQLQQMDEEAQDTDDDSDSEIKLPSVDLPQDIPEETDEPAIKAHGASGLGATFNATTDAAVQDIQEDKSDGFNQEMKVHPVEPILPPAAENSFSIPPANDVASNIDVPDPLEEARRAVEQAANQAAFNPAGNPVLAINSQPMSNDAPQQINHNDVQANYNQPQQPMMPPAPMAPPVTPPPMPPPMPPMMPQQPMSIPPPVGMSPQAQPYDPNTNMNTSAQTFSIPPPQSIPPPVGMPPTPGLPPAPQDNGQFPPPPPMPPQ